MSDTENGHTQESPDQMRVQYGFRLIVIGMLVTAGVFTLSILRLHTAGEVSSAVGPISSVFGTLVGAFFGINAGSARVEKAEQRADQAQKKADLALGKLPPDDAQAVLKEFQSQ
jgi:hypothetical protein